MIIVTSASIACLLALLALLDGSGVVAVWHVLAIAGAIALIVGFDFPAGRRSSRVSSPAST